MPLQRIIGQGHAVEFLRDCIKASKVAHAYLFLGPAGAGKTTTAIEFAKMLNCQTAEKDSCDKCPACVRISKREHPDLFYIARGEDRAQIPIDAIRSLQQRLLLKPFEARWKIAIIANAEDMSEEAANSLLKILEEPPVDTLFILTASHQRALAATIVSRCQIVRFRPLTTDEASDILMRDFSIDAKEARFLSAISGAHVARALELKEKDTLSWKNEIIDTFHQAPELLKQDSPALMKAKRRLQIEALDILTGFYRDLLVYKYTGEEALIINIDRMDTINILSRELTAQQITSCIAQIEKTKAALEANANAKLAIGVLREALAV